MFHRPAPGNHRTTGDYERSTTVDRPVDDLFAYLSQVENLPEYFSRITNARPVTGEQVEVDATLDADRLPPEVGHQAGDGEKAVHGQAWFRVDADHRKVEWGAAGPHDYHGELEVDGAQSGSQVTVRLHTLHDDAEAINQGLDETLANIQRLTDSRT
jgi:hypothetical protein